MSERLRPPIEEALHTGGPETSGEAKKKPTIIFAPRVDSLRQIQDTQDVFAYHAVPSETAGKVLSNIAGELVELEEAVEIGDPDEVGSEVADVILLASRVASLHNVDLAQAVSAKMRRNADKYNPYRIREMREAGMDEQTAMKTAKDLWNRDDDKLYK